MTDPTPQPASNADKEPAWAAGLRSLIEKQGGPEPAAALLIQENHQLRQQKRDLEGRLPKEGSVILAGDDAARWERVKGYNPDEIAKTIKEHGEFQQQIADVSRRETIRKAADAAGLKASVLERLPGLPPVEVTEVDGKAIAHVVTDTGKVPLIDYVTSQFADFLPALQSTQQQTTGAPWPRQPTGGAQRPADPVDSALATFQAARDSRPNPLAPKTK